MRSLYLNPGGGVNQELPNMALAYACTLDPGPVVDLNTLPEPPRRYLERPADRLIMSVRQLTLNQARRIAAKYGQRYPKSEIYSLTGLVDVQCCYRFIPMGLCLELEGVFGDDLPFPEYENFDSFPVFRRNWQSGRWHYAIMTSLGCPFGCIYCESRRRRWRARSPGHCVAELQAARDRWNIKSFVVIDDCFNVDKARVLEFCRQVTPLGLSWHCSNGVRADLFDDEIAAAMLRAGCEAISFGIETVTPQVLAAIDKGENLEQIVAAVRVAHKYWQRVGGFFILGLPGATYRSDAAALAFCRDHGIAGLFSYHVGNSEADRLDRSFYGPNARPNAQAYSPLLQRRIYWQARAQNLAYRLAGAVRRRLVEGASRGR
ncbi:MAG: B12-binding domain-containing radical SAM protein [Desulfobaccales bacterium]